MANARNSYTIYIAKDGNPGADGSNGNDGRGISSITEFYLSTNVSTGVTRSTQGWSTSIQTVTPINKYLWNYEKVIYSDNTSSNTTPCVIGVYGDTGASGEDGRGISSIFEYYLATNVSTGVTRSTQGWTTSIQTITSTKRYLWNYEKILYTDNTSSNTTPVIIGVYGDKGESGQDGSNGEDGNDAEFYDLLPLTEKAIVYIDSNNPNGTLAIQLQYNIRHITGNTTETITASSSGYHIRFKTNVSSTYYNLSNGVTNPSYTNNSFLTNYHTASSKPDYLIVELCNGSSNTLVNTKIVPVVFNDSLLFDINTSLNQITSQVQGHTSSIEDLLNRKVGGRNFASQTSDEWSDWITLRNQDNQVVYVCASTYLPSPKNVGDYFTYQITIEWDDLVCSNNSSGRILAQTAVDGAYTTPNPGWNSNLIQIRTASGHTLPGDEVIQYVNSQAIVEGNKDATLIRPAIRFDYLSGKFRYKCVKIERGNTATDWTVNPDDIDSSIISVTNSISNITQTMDSITSTVNSHTTNINTLNSSLSSIQNDMSSIEQRADSIISSVESLFIDTLFDVSIYGGNFFKKSSETNSSLNYNSSTNTYKARCTSKLNYVSITNINSTKPETTSTINSIDKGKYQISFKVHLSEPNVKYTSTIQIFDSSFIQQIGQTSYYSYTELYNQTIVDENYSPQTNNTIVVDSFEVPKDNCRFKIVFRSDWNDKQNSQDWYFEITDFKIVMQTQAASILEQKADSITSTVYDNKRDIDNIKNDNKNLFGTTSYDGGELKPGNKWEFYNNNVNYIFDNWTKYNTVFVDGECSWQTLGDGETYIYSPYVYLSDTKTYTLNCLFDYTDGSDRIDLCQYGNEDLAKSVTTIQATKPLYPEGHISQINFSLDDETDVITFTIQPGSGSKYCRIRFRNIVSNYDPYNDYSIYLNHVRLYQGTFNASEFNSWPRQQSMNYSQILQTGNSISLKVRDDLYNTGIDIESQQVTLTADKFVVNNNSNEHVLSTDSDGNLEVVGTIRAKNFYHELCFFVDSGIYHFPNDGNIKWCYCDDLTTMRNTCIANGWSDYLAFTEGKYYSWPRTDTPHYIQNAIPQGFKPCTYTADMVVLLPKYSVQWKDSTPVLLPDPVTFTGKIVQIMCSLTISEVLPDIDINIGCVQNNKLSLGFYASMDGNTYESISSCNTISISPFYNVTLMSVGGYWTVIDISSKELPIHGN